MNWISVWFDNMLVFVAKGARRLAVMRSRQVKEGSIATQALGVYVAALKRLTLYVVLLLIVWAITLTMGKLLPIETATLLLTLSTLLLGVAAWPVAFVFFEHERYQKIAASLVAAELGVGLKLLPEQGRDLILAGDPDVTTQGFRGASPRLLAEAPQLDHRRGQAVGLLDPDVGDVADPRRPRRDGSDRGQRHDRVRDVVHVDVDTAQLGTVVRRLAPLGVRSLTSTPPTLEEMFLRHYGDEAAGGEAGGDTTVGEKVTS